MDDRDNFVCTGTVTVTVGTVAVKTECIGRMSTMISIRNLIGMTSSAAGITRFGVQAVKPGTGAYIGGDVFVTIEAQCSLLGAFEFRVAGIAIFLVLGMTFDDFTGHHQRLDLRVGWFGYHPQ